MIDSFLSGIYGKPPFNRLPPQPFIEALMLFVMICIALMG